jgi:hypothetical protein
MMPNGWERAESAFRSTVDRVAKHPDDEIRDTYEIRNAIYGALSRDVPPPNPDTDVLWVGLHTADPFRAVGRVEPYPGDRYTRMPIVRNRREVLGLETPPGKYTHIGIWTDRICGHLVDRWPYATGSDWGWYVSKLEFDARAAYFDALTPLEYDGEPERRHPDLDVPIQSGPPDGVVGLHLIDAERFIRLRGLDPNTRVIIRPEDIEDEWRFDGEVIFTTKAQQLSGHIPELRNIIQHRQEIGL